MKKYTFKNGKLVKSTVSVPKPTLTIKRVLLNHPRVIVMLIIAALVVIAYIFRDAIISALSTDLGLKTPAQGAIGTDSAGRNADGAGMIPVA